MVKRLAVLAVVFALASTADAALSLYIDGSAAPSSIELLTDEVITIQIYSSDTSNWLGYIVGDGVGGLYDLWELWRDPPVLRPDPDVVEPDWGTGFSLSVYTISEPPPSGLQFTVEYSSSEVGSDRIGLFLPPNYSWDGDEIDRIDITIVPEPMTMSLLALGGALVLMRKRRK
ncbi:MAG: PEP-CTERM sorting domain-containing protein [Planctomycetota bacterium]|nr:MAG: PEP-CTERM sorting domain-containing protein [Planctomycetota bacterium]